MRCSAYRLKGFRIDGWKRTSHCEAVQCGTDGWGVVRWGEAVEVAERTDVSSCSTSAGRASNAWRGPLARGISLSRLPPLTANRPKTLPPVTCAPGISAD